MSEARTRPLPSEFDLGPLSRNRQEEWAFSAARDLRERVRQMVADIEIMREWQLAPGAVENLYAGTFARATKMFGAALLLCDRGYGEEAAMLNRSLFEHMVVAWWMTFQDDQHALIETVGRQHEHSRVLYDRAAQQHPELDLSGRHGVADLDEERITELDREFKRFGAQWHGKRLDQLVREVESAGADPYAGVLWPLFRFVNHANSQFLHHSAFGIVEAVRWESADEAPTLVLGPSRTWSGASLWMAQQCYGLLVYATLRRLSPHRADDFQRFFDALAPRFRTVTARDARGVGRNDSCPCGSGEKFKHCHLDYVVAET